MRTALRRNAIIAGCAFGLVIALVLVAERGDTARTRPTEEQAKHAAKQPRIAERAANGSSELLSPPMQVAAAASRADSTATKHVVIAVVTPWVEIARMSPYVQTNQDERRAIRDLYWWVCVEAKVPLEQRSLAYSQFVRDWHAIESGASDDSTRTTPAQLLHEQQAAVPPFVTAEAMSEWCQR